MVIDAVTKMQWIDGFVFRGRVRAKDNMNGEDNNIVLEWNGVGRWGSCTHNVFINERYTTTS